MAFSWEVGASIAIITIILIIWCIVGVKRQKFTLEEIGTISFTEQTSIDEDILSSTPYFSVTTLQIIRSIFGLFALITLIYRLIETGQQIELKERPYGSFSFWGWILLTYFFISTPIITLITTTNKCNCCIKYMRISVWIIFECLTCLVIWIDFVAWCFVPYKKLLTYTQFTIHVFNFIFIYFELVISDLPYGNAYHAIFPLWIAMIYTIIVWIGYALGVPFAYPFLDYTKPANSIVSFCILIILLIFWFISYAFKKLFVIKVLRRKQDKMLVRQENNINIPKRVEYCNQ
eukprot:505139_1